MDGGTNEQTIKGLFALLDEWRHLPAYRLEPRADAFFALFLRDVMAEHFNVEIHDIVIPEMPLRRGTLWPEKKNSPNKSVKVDYAVFTKDLSKVYLVELKTDLDYLSNDHSKYLERAKAVGFRELVTGVIDIARATDVKFIQKYIHLLKRLSDLGFVYIPDSVYEYSFPKPKTGIAKELQLVRNLVDNPEPLIEIVYVAPFVHPKHRTIDFDEYAGIVKDKGEIGRILAEHLINWKIQAGLPDPRTLKETP